MLKRSKWKFNYVHKDLYQAFFSKESGVVLKTQSRSSVIIPMLLNVSVGLHDGYSFFKLTIKNDMVGYKLGEFVRTRQAFRYGKK